jgi:hypothetical protein
VAASGRKEELIRRMLDYQRRQKKASLPSTAAGS